MDIVIRAATHPGGEQRISIGGKRYKVDGYCEIDDVKHVFEFHGCWWHGAPCCFPDRKAVHPKAKVTFEALWKKTSAKREALESAGYEYHEMRECEWRKQSPRDAAVGCE